LFSHLYHYASAVNYAEDLTKLVDKIVILCEIAALSREIEDDVAGPSSLRRSASVTQYGITKEEFVGILEESNNDEGSSISRNTKGNDYQGGLIVDPTKSDLRRVRLDQSQRAKITELLGAWCVIKKNLCRFWFYENYLIVLCLLQGRAGFRNECRGKHFLLLCFAIKLLAYFSFFCFSGRCFNKRNPAISKFVIIFEQSIYF
jgi:hypothetical protein